MGLKNPVGEFIKWHGKNFKVIGVVKNMVMNSPFDPASPTVFMMNKERSLNVIVLKLAPTVGVQQALEHLKAVFKTYNASAPFDYKFADQEYALKFADEVRIGKLAAFFTILAIFISCLGLFGIASFVAEQRVKEIGVRKVLGASVFGLWQLLSKDFVLLVLISLVIASPIAYYLMNNWLKKYQYHSNMEWWVFAATGLGVVAITLATVSFQSIKAALANPVKSLKTE
jgi:ABC-type antimicrobial peptide transport system permease subunit